MGKCMCVEKNCSASVKLVMLYAASIVRCGAMQFSVIHNMSIVEHVTHCRNFQLIDMYIAKGGKIKLA